MPPSHSRRRGRFRPLVWVLLAIAIVGAFSGLTFLSIGQLLYHEDHVDKADAIFVLAGSWMERVAESGDLYMERRAPMIVLSRELPDHGEEALRGRGIDIPGVTDVQIAALVSMGVPRESILVTAPQVATATEAATLRNLAVQHRWRRVIVVTSKYHTGRARIAFQRQLKDSGVDIIVRGSRYDPWDPQRWWWNRVWFRLTLFEAQKFLAYWVGLAD